MKSWGLLQAEPAVVFRPRNRFEAEKTLSGSSGISRAIHGAGRSYSDVALPSQGSAAVLAGELRHIISFDRFSGVIEVEAGVTLRAIQELALPAGWGLPIIPGTSWASAGGAFANDVHGKNHALRGAFSRCVRSVRMLRQDRGAFRLDRSDAPLWSATVGGLGATGVIVALEIQLEPWASPWIEFSQARFEGIEEFMSMSDQGSEYSVGWLDAMRKAPRGILFRGRRARSGAACAVSGQEKPIPSIPFRVISPSVSRIFNQGYWMAHPDKEAISAPWPQFFCPLDALGGWNRLYGPGGFVQFQCVLPLEIAVAALGEICAACRSAGQGSFLSVVKKFGEIPSEGILSFARPGVTFAMDFPRSAGTEALMARLSAIALGCGGAIYPAKTRIETLGDFELSFPSWRHWRSQWDGEGAGGSLWIERIFK